MQYKAVHLTCGLQKYDHVSQYKANLRWLLVSEFMQYWLHYSYHVQSWWEICLQPTINFGCKHSYKTRRHHDLQKFFPLINTRAKKIFDTRWNSLPSNLFKDIRVFHNSLLKHLHDLSYIIWLYIMLCYILCI